MPDNLITIGITCYREGEWLRECWESVLAQTDDRWEAVLVMDGGADERTIEVFNSIEHSKLRKFEFDENVGLNPAKNKAFELTSTLYHFVLDADDMLPANAVQMVLNTFEKHPEAACVYGDHEQFDDSGVIRILNFQPMVDIDNRDQIYGIGAAAYKCDIWRNVGGFTLDPVLARRGSDTDLHYTILEKGYYEVHCGGIFYLRRKGHESLSEKNVQDLHKIADRLVQRHPILFGDPKFRQKYLMNYYCLSMSANYRAGNIYVCSNVAGRAIRRGGIRAKHLWAMLLYPYLPSFLKKPIKKKLDARWLQ